MIVATPLSSRSSAGGFVLIDSIFALGIVLLLAGLMTIAMHQRQRMTSSLGDRRDASREAEATLTALQSRATPPAPPAGAKVHVHPLSGSAPAGMQWTQIEVEWHKQSVRLIGLAPKATSPATTRGGQ